MRLGDKTLKQVQGDTHAVLIAIGIISGPHSYLGKLQKQARQKQREKYKLVTYNQWTYKWKYNHVATRNSKDDLGDQGPFIQYIQYNADK